MKFTLVIALVLLSCFGYSQDKSSRIFIPKSDNPEVKEETNYIRLEHPWSISFILAEKEEIIEIKVINGKMDTMYEFGKEYITLRAKKPGKLTVEATFKKIGENGKPKYFKEKQTVEALADPGYFELKLLEDNFCKNKKVFLYAVSVRTKKRLSSDFYPPQTIGNSSVKVFDGEKLIGEVKIKEDLSIDLSVILRETNPNSEISIIVEPLLVSRKYRIISIWPLQPFKLNLRCE